MRAVAGVDDGDFGFLGQLDHYLGLIIDSALERVSFDVESDNQYLRPFFVNDSCEGSLAFLQS
jgi:hypothetical protein